MLVQVEWLGATGFLSAWMTRNQNEFRVFHCQVADAIPDCSQVRTPWTSYISQRHSSYIKAIECAWPNFEKKTADYSRRSCAWTLDCLSVNFSIAQRWQWLCYGNLADGPSWGPTPRLSQIALAQICLSWSQATRSQPHNRLGWRKRHYVFLNWNF